MIMQKENNLLARLFYFEEKNWVILMPVVTTNILGFEFWYVTASWVTGELSCRNLIMRTTWLTGEPLVATSLWELLKSWASPLLQFCCEGYVNRCATCENFITRVSRVTSKPSCRNFIARMMRVTGEPLVATSLWECHESRASLLLDFIARAIRFAGLPLVETSLWEFHESRTSPLVGTSLWERRDSRVSLLWQLHCERATSHGRAPFCDFVARAMLLVGEPLIVALLWGWCESQACPLWKLHCEISMSHEQALW